MPRKRKKHLPAGQSPAARTLTMPAYMARFKCIGPACEDTCCGSWAIPVDRSSYERYQRATDPELGPRLRQHLIRVEGDNEGEWARFELRPDEKTCVFLTESRLCELQLRHGPDFLCATCAGYPRVSLTVDGQPFQAGDISCPEVARLALFEPMAMKRVAHCGRWDTRQTLVADITTATAESGDAMAVFPILRDEAIALLQRRDVSLGARLAAVGMAMDELSRASGEQAWSNEEGGRNRLTAGAPLYERDVRAAFGRQAGELAATEERLAALKPGFEMPVTLIHDLAVERFFGPGASARYVDQVAGIQRQLGLFPRRAPSKQSLKAYARAHVRLYAPYIGRRPHVMENYLVNQIYASSFPFTNGRSLFEEYGMFAARYALVKAHLVGAAAARGELTDALVVEVVHVLARALDHTPTYQQHVLSLLEPHTHSVDGLLELFAS